ncbi:MAG TPA: hypothetical protein VGX48_16095 [Pyrinomonadaceae bacterium]|jgi:hypothetical protein|nr:hypothetical protein [Pyrinomonadaceae bacterium]
MKRVLEVVGWLTAVALFAFAGHAVLAATPQAQSQQGVTRERVRGASERPETNPVRIVRAARTVYVRETRHLDKTYLEYKLQKYNELRDWDLSLVSDERAADLVISVEKTLMNYIFTVTDPRTSVIVASGKCVAVNGQVAAEYLGREIIKKLRDVRASADRGRKAPRRSSDEDEESES